CAPRENGLAAGAYAPRGIRHDAFVGRCSSRAPDTGPPLEDDSTPGRARLPADERDRVDCRVLCGRACCPCCRCPLTSSSRGARRGGAQKKKNPPLPG